MPSLLPAGSDVQARVTSIDGWAFELEAARRALVEQLKTHGLDGFGLETHPSAVRAAGALVHYLRGDAEGRPRPRSRDRLSGRRRLPPDRSDDDAESGGRSNPRAGRAPGSLLDEIDRTGHADGRPDAQAWLLRPLVSIERIQDRLDAVEEFAFRATERAKVRDTFKSIHDVERLVGRAALGNAGPRDLVSLRQSLAAVPRVKLLLDDLQAPLVRSLLAELDDLTDIRQALEQTLLDEPPVFARDGGAIRDGVDPTSTSCGRSVDPASSASPRWRTPSARGPGSRP